VTENATEKIEHSNLHIEFYNQNHKWVPTGDAPHPLSSKESPQVLPEAVWVAYVDYLNAREKYASTHPGSFRLTTYTTTTTKEIIHV
jgi:hypothetical protein